MSTETNGAVLGRDRKQDPAPGEEPPAERRPPRRIGELGDESVFPPGEDRPGPCSRFVLKEFFD